MTIATSPASTLADLLLGLGGISPARVRATPPPGTASVDDVVVIERQEDRLFELVDGTLVEKVTAFRESLLASFLIAALRAFVDLRRLGLVTAPDGMMRLAPGLVRIPDLAFVSWSRLPGGRIPEEAVPAIVPDLAVEILSEGNTAGEVQRKLEDYLGAGVRLVWLVDWKDRAVTTHEGSSSTRRLTTGDVLDGGAVLPGFTLEIATLFAELDRQG